MRQHHPGGVRPGTAGYPADRRPPGSRRPLEDIRREPALPAVTLQPSCAGIHRRGQSDASAPSSREDFGEPADGLTRRRGEFRWGYGLPGPVSCRRRLGPPTDLGRASRPTRSGVRPTFVSHSSLTEDPIRVGLDSPTDHRTGDLRSGPGPAPATDPSGTDSHSSDGSDAAAATRAARPPRRDRPDRSRAAGGKRAPSVSDRSFAVRPATTDPSAPRRWD
jgi:hypothetical protein